MQVELIATTKLTTTDFTDEVAFNAAICYQSSLKAATKVNLSKDKLFEMGHHTPFESSSYTFAIEDIPISLVTFGLHETHPMYNTLQRSFRYTIDDTLMEKVASTAKFLDELLDHDAVKLNRILNWIERGIEFYNQNIDELVIGARDALTEERPNFRGGDIQAVRLAQEQGRSILSSGLPTGMSYTVDTITLLSMYYAAWNKPMRDVTKSMLDASGVPGILYKKDRNDVDMDWEPNFIDVGQNYKTGPVTSLVSNDIRDMHIERLAEMQHPVDMLHFSPRARTVKVDSVNFKHQMSIMTYGQFQRHRTITRSNVSHLSTFMLPPLMARSHNWKDFAAGYWNEYLNMVADYGIGIMQFVSPYGASVQFESQAGLAGLTHFMSKRCCVRAQLEISQIAHEMKKLALINTKVGASCELDKGCHEGSMFCGRDVTKAIMDTRTLI